MGAQGLGSGESELKGFWPYSRVQGVWDLAKEAGAISGKAIQGSSQSWKSMFCSVSKASDMILQGWSEDASAICRDAAMLRSTYEVAG